MTITGTPKPSTPVLACTACWSPINWCESFHKFGHGEGDDCVHTHQVARVLRAAGYDVKVSEGGMHNAIISEIGYNMTAQHVQVMFMDNLPPGNQVGYSNPYDMLPVDVIKVLDEHFGHGEFFG